VSLLKQKGITTLVDVRLRPGHASIGAFKKAKEPKKGVQGLLVENGILYIFLLGLDDIFIDYEDWQVRYKGLFEIAGDLLIERLQTVAAPFCLMCAEKHTKRCHRCLIAEYLLSKGHQAENLE